MTDSRTSVRPASADRAAASEWPGQSVVRTGTELLLGLSFFVTLAFGGFGAAMHRTSLVAELSAIAFICALVCVLVNWFAAAPDPREDRHVGWD